MIAACAAGCGPEAYDRRDMLEPRVSIDCVDINVIGKWPSESTGPVAQIDLGNRCDHGVDIDLRAVRATGELLEDATHIVTRVPLVAYDPDHEMETRTLSPGAHGSEWIEFHPVDGIDRIDRIEVDVAAVVEGSRLRGAVFDVDVPSKRPSTVSEAEVRP